MAGVHKIVIVGTGFGGIYALKSIAKQFRVQRVHITIIGQHNYFLFTPMLHEVATGVQSHYQAAVAVRELLPNKSSTFVMAEVSKIDRETKTLETTVGPIAYDTLVIATGASTNYFGIPGAEEHTMPMKTLKDAQDIRQKMSENFEKALVEKDPEKRRALLTVTVIGGGPTGVEFAAEAAETMYDTFVESSQGRFQKKDLTVRLIHRGAGVVQMYPDALQKYSMRSLEKKGVQVCVGQEVIEITEGCVTTASGEQYASALMLWVAGVKAILPSCIPTLELAPSGRVPVDNTLRSADPSIYVLGDAAAFPTEDGRGFPMLAQVAVQQGKYLGVALHARHSGNEPKPFQVHMLGELVSLGSWSAIGDVLGVPIKGPIAACMWKGIYIMKFVAFPKRLKILMDWFVGLFSRRDMTISS